ncbi:MAG: glycogen/starch synthase, partial [Treponema sp.]|nr:glycogen/starch synthase [Treponema sp.]
MKILMVSSEAVPYAKTGGLADMVSALAIQLTNMG